MNLRQKLSTMVRYNRTMRELRSLDARQLSDIGITRADLHDIAMGRRV